MRPYIIFDFDGTLVQSKALAIQLFNQLAAKYGGRSIRHEEIPALSDMSIPERLKVLKVPAYKLPALLIEGKRKYKEEIVSLQPVNGIREVLSGLKEQGYTLGILSSNIEENIHRFIDLHQLDFFDHIHSATNLFGKHKALSSMTKKLGITSDDILYIGDELRDIQACKKINAKVIAVAWGFDSPALLASSSPDFLCHTPEELLLVDRIYEGILH
ncbi:HAD-IA family hydrolase [Paenibacillus sp. YPG26]|uniref:HAD-IA family hydrolase n=1 Tax=Paenibacillus sp. YPG26 TaxID=2878915 RepID=UPI00203C43AC|nr:HAD-IA family hydrolase [Paenibacillus sp. YPG26]USB31934.1 HAD-IA family hydrolase [Paenibacillus sp. YPG26]